MNACYLHLWLDSIDFMLFISIGIRCVHVWMRTFALTGSQRGSSGGSAGSSRDQRPPMDPRDAQDPNKCAHQCLRHCWQGQSLQRYSATAASGPDSSHAGCVDCVAVLWLFLLWWVCCPLPAACCLLATLIISHTHTVPT